MPSEREIKIEQRRRLYHLLVLKQSSDEIEGFISQTITEMDEVDVAYVQKQVEEYFAVKKSK